LYQEYIRSKASITDDVGTEFPSADAARRQAVVFAGEVLRDNGENFGRKPTGVCG
jgi:hypothetical protein